MNKECRSRVLMMWNYRDEDKPDDNSRWHAHRITGWEKKKDAIVLSVLIQTSYFYCLIIIIFHVWHRQQFVSCSISEWRTNYGTLNSAHQNSFSHQHVRTCMKTLILWWVLGGDIFDEWISVVSLNSLQALLTAWFSWIKFSLQFSLSRYMGVWID